MEGELFSAFCDQQTDKWKHYTLSLTFYFSKHAW